jgi:hypothetical protein
MRPFVSVRTTLGGSGGYDHALLHSRKVHSCTLAVAFGRAGGSDGTVLEPPRSARGGRPSRARGPGWTAALQGGLHADARRGSGLGGPRARLRPGEDHGHDGGGQGDRAAVLPGGRGFKSHHVSDSDKTHGFPPAIWFARPLERSRALPALPSVPVPRSAPRVFRDIEESEGRAPVASETYPPTSGSRPRRHRSGPLSPD